MNDINFYQALTTIMTDVWDRAKQIDAAIDEIYELIEADRQARGEPVAWFVDWPDEPELGHYFSEGPVDGARSRALVFQNVGLQPQQQVGEPVGYFYQWELDRSLKSYPNGFPEAVPVYTTPQPSLGGVCKNHPQQIPKGYRLQPLSEFDAMMDTRTIPEGYKLVPIEPTDRMLGAALRHIDGMASMPSAYKAMLEAAPEPKEPK